MFKFQKSLLVIQMPLKNLEYFFGLFYFDVFNFKKHCLTAFTQIIAGWFAQMFAWSCKKVLLSYIYLFFIRSVLLKLCKARKNPTFDHKIEFWSWLRPFIMNLKCFYELSVHFMPRTIIVFTKNYVWKSVYLAYNIYSTDTV